MFSKKSKITALMVSVLLIFSVFNVIPTATQAHAATSSTIVYGDVNGDGVCDLKDATSVCKYMVGQFTIPTAQTVASDVNLDGVISLKDATCIQKYLVGLISSLPYDASNELYDIASGTILHCWCWNFNTIKANIPSIAAAGFTSIQTSPINQVIVGDNGGMQLMGNGKWYYHYQPTNYTIGNYQLGTLDEFKTMCQTAHQYHINVIVDSVVNHMTGSQGSIDSSIKNIAGGAFHNVSGGIGSDRYSITQCQLLGLSDLNTQNPNIQQLIKNYLVSCVQAGANGFRYDAAKHIELPDDSTSGKPAFASNFWPTVLDNGSKFQYGEILQDGDGDSSSCRLAAYIKYMHVTSSSYGARIRSAVTGSNLAVSNIQDYLVSGIDPSNLVTWFESHDNYCGDNTYTIPVQKVIDGWAIITARAGGTPLFFDRPAGSTTSSQWGNNLIGAAGSDMYKDSQVVAVNFFRNKFSSQPEALSNPNNNTKTLMIERGTSGCTIVNTDSNSLVLSNCPVKSMADGTYKDQVSGNSFTVSGGKISGTVPAGKVAVIYNK
ncbi:MAG: alpha-amylase family glycosyl hydrolase [Bacillota bacterium]|nr:alpha-amylase family glycosyl hydrolase [Bacillota bacterium]